MPIYRAVIERQTTTREVVEIAASDMLAAAHRANDFAVNRKHRRGVTILQAHEDDRAPITAADVVSLKEK